MAHFWILMTHLLHLCELKYWYLLWLKVIQTYIKMILIVSLQRSLLPNCNLIGLNYTKHSIANHPWNKNLPRKQSHCNEITVYRLISLGYTLHSTPYLLLYLWFSFTVCWSPHIVINHQTMNTQQFVVML